jgi:acyl carrier protein
MSSNEIKPSIRDYLSRHIGGAVVKDSDDIFAMGLVNSMFAMQLVTFIESAFRLEIGPDDLEMDNFRSIDAMTRLVEKKGGGQELR